MSIIEIAWGTPWWAYVILIYLLLIGINATRQHTVSLMRFIIVPIIFGGFILLRLVNQTNHLLISISLVALIAGYAIGWFLLTPRIRIDHINKLIHMQGTPIPLLLYMLFFAINYFFGFTYAIYPEAQESFAYNATQEMLTRFISGIIIGRSLHIIRTYMKNR